MTYSISLLDKSPIADGATAKDALQFTVQLAKRAEALGFKRFWIAEHHGSPGLASSAPEIVVSHVLAHTSRIRVGSGGVMLQHYSPFKVAETFKVLAALGPGRVDLGVGKAPGGLPFTTRALQWRHDKANRADFETQLALLNAFLDWGVDARHGWQFCYAGHFNGDEANIERSLQTYRDATGRAPLLALYAVAAPTDEEARQLVGPLRIFRLQLATGQCVNLGTAEAATEFARQTGASDYRIDERRPHVIKGSADEARRQLDALSERYGIEEFVIDSPLQSYPERLRSVELLGSTIAPARARPSLPNLTN